MFEDDSKSLIDVIQDLTDVPLFRWDYCVTSAVRHLTRDSDLFIQEDPSSMPLAEWRLLKETIIIYKRQFEHRSPNSDLRGVPLVGAHTLSSVDFDVTLNEYDLVIKRYKTD